MIISYVIGPPSDSNMTQTKFLWSNAIADGSTSPQTETHVFNGPKLMGSANRKEYRNIDNQGNAQLYTIGMRVFGTAHLTVTTAPNTYVTRRAVKAWHDARMKMYKRAGISMKSLGYGRSLRPYLDVNHENGTTTEIDDESSGTNGITPPYTGDEWTYSRAAVATPQESTYNSNVNSWDLVDTYSFTLCDASVTENDTADDPDESGSTTDQDSFVSVGMLKEWLGSFAKRTTPSGVTTQLDDDNALLQLISQQGADKEEVLELAKDAQGEVRPWDLGGATHYSGTYAGVAHAVANESSYIIFQAPCGLFNVQSYSEAAAQTVYTEFEVLDIRDM